MSHENLLFKNEQSANSIKIFHNNEPKNRVKNENWVKSGLGLQLY